ncbi:MAG: multicopper oxidase family protein [Candidatus Entotheonellia bacterium]
MRALGRIVLAGLVLCCGAYGAREAGLRFRAEGGVLGSAITLFREPPVWSSTNGTLTGTLVVQRAPLTLGDRQILTQTYAGGIPGPTLRVNAGDRIQLRLINNMTPSGSVSPGPAARPHPPPRPHAHHAGPPRAWQGPFASLLSAVTERAVLPKESDMTLPTNLHTHGLQVDPRGNSDNPFLDIPPGDYFDYTITIPTLHPSGLFWYHPHRHQDVTRQLWNGLAGAIIVAGGLDTVPEIAAMTDQLLVINELLLDEHGQVPSGMILPTAGPVPFSSLPAVPMQIYFPVNGVLQPTMFIQTGETQRWRILNASAHRFIQLALDGHTLHQIAQDGKNFPLSVGRQTILMAPGNRVEVLIQGQPAGTYQLKALAYDQGHPGGPRPELTLATLVSRVRPFASPPAPVEFPLRLIPSQQDAISGDLSASPVDVQRTVTFSGQVMSAPLLFELDGKTFDPARTDNTVVVGQVEEWTLVNDDVFQHPMHIHVNPFQVVQVNDEPYPEPTVWWDVFALPPHGSVTVRMFFRPDIIGSTVYHCHITPHEDLGMMGRLDLIPPGPVPPPVVPVGPFPTGDPIPPPGPPPFAPLLDRPYVFTHLANGMSNVAPVGREVAIQLPGDPTLWSVSIDGSGVQESAADAIDKFPSQGQFEGADAVYQFNFTVVSSEATTITMVPVGGTPTLPWLPSFTLTLNPAASGAQ